MKIVIETIEHSAQRYPTVGDWQFDGIKNELHVRVSKMPIETYELLVGLHEAIEAISCLKDGVAEDVVDTFDMTFVGEGEPGDNTLCPYRKQHFLAENIERILAAAWIIDWNNYDRTINQLFEGDKDERTNARTNPTGTGNGIDSEGTGSSHPDSGDGVKLEGAD